MSLAVGARLGPYEVLAPLGGRRQLWKQFSASDPAGVTPIYLMSLTVDGKAYVYSYDRVLSDL